VIRTTDERAGASIRWMNISEYLERESKGGRVAVKQIEFRGNPLTARAVLNLARSDGVESGGSKHS
jgi:hypothetical protein